MHDVFVLSAQGVSLLSEEFTYDQKMRMRNLPADKYLRTRNFSSNEIHDKRNFSFHIICDKQKLPPSDKK